MSDFLNEMSAAAYVAGISPLATRTFGKLLSSDAPRYDDLDADFVVILIPRSAICRTQHGGDVAARCRRIIVDLIQKQLESGRHAICYGSPQLPVWESEEFLILMNDSRLHHTRLRWCQMGARDPVTNLGFRLIARFLSTMQLWTGDPAKSAHCRCTDHADLSVVSEDGVKAARQLSSHWRVMHYFILSLARSGRPGRPVLEREGARLKTEHI